MSIERGDIYFVDLAPTIGREQTGRRPVLVLSIDDINRHPLVVTVVIGTKGDNVRRDFASNVRVAAEESGLPLETVFMGFQIRSLDPSRLSGRPAGRLSGNALQRVESVVRHCLGL